MRVLASLALVLGACMSWVPAPSPMYSVEWMQPADRPKAKCLVVFLPGLGDSVKNFEREGFVAEVRKYNLSVDMIAAGARIGHYLRGKFLERLATDVVGPARARGYEQVWLIGVSLGGMGTLFYSRAHTPEVTGVLALAPYLGESDLIDEISAQGGLARWKAPRRAEVMSPDNYQREIWRWLQALARGREPGPKLYIGFGRADKLVRQSYLLAATLRDDHKYTVAGAHDWKTWKVLLGKFLQSSDFARSCR